VSEKPHSLVLCRSPSVQYTVMHHQRTIAIKNDSSTDETEQTGDEKAKIEGEEDGENCQPQTNLLANACITGIAENTLYKSNGESMQLLCLLWPHQETNVCVCERERERERPARSPRVLGFSKRR